MSCPQSDLLRVTWVVSSDAGEAWAACGGGGSSLARPNFRWFKYKPFTVRETKLPGKQTDPKGDSVKVLTLSLTAGPAGDLPLAHGEMGMLPQGNCGSHH